MVVFITSQYKHLKGFTGIILFISQLCPAPRKAAHKNIIFDVGERIPSTPK